MNDRTWVNKPEPPEFRLWQFVLILGVCSLLIFTGLMFIPIVDIVVCFIVGFRLKQSLQRHIGVKYNTSQLTLQLIQLTIFCGFMPAVPLEWVIKKSLEATETQNLIVPPTAPPHVLVVTINTLVMIGAILMIGLIPSIVNAMKQIVANIGGWNTPVRKLFF